MLTREYVVGLHPKGAQALLYFFVHGNEIVHNGQYSQA